MNYGADMKRFVVDLETDGLLQEVTKIHCASVVAMDSSYSRLYLAHDMDEFLAFINDPEKELIGHNIFNYDLKVIEKLYGWKPYKDQPITDTMLLAQLIFADLKNEDIDNSGGWDGKIFSKKDTGSHSLRAWGQRIHQFKGDYEGGWEEYNDDMGRYCIGDTYTTKGLLNFLLSKQSEKLLSGQSIELENSIAPILSRQQAFGILYDQQKSQELISILTAKKTDIFWQLQDIFPPRQVSIGKFIPKVNNKARGYVKGVEIDRFKTEEFNPGSRQQIVSRLVDKFGWNPEEFTEKGNVKMNEDIIEALPFKEMAPLKEYLTINKRISQIETGKQGWINKIDSDGRIRGAIRQNGAVTGRMAHFSPNLAQVPSSDSLYGKECRALFAAPAGKIMVGCDADALEMRNLAGYLTPYDKGRFRDSLLHGKKEDGTDPHSMNMDAMELMGHIEHARDAAKTVFYAWIYGARNAKIGKILLEWGMKFIDYVPDFEKQLEGIMIWAEDKGIERTQAYWECWLAGKHCLSLFGDRIPELIELKKKIHERVEEVGYIKGLDGRKLFMRSEHGELNTVLQSAGAIIMKKALWFADTDLQAAELKPGIDYEFILNVHDEFQLEVTNEKEIVDKVCEIVQNSIKKAGESFDFPCEMKGSVKVGSNWSETH